MTASRVTCFLTSMVAGLAILPPAAGARLTDEDTAKKREGWYVTALPIANYTEDTGYGYGSRI